MSGILEAVTSYLAKTGMPESTFGRTVAKDPRLVSDLRNGRAPRQATRAKVLQFIAQHQNGEKQ